MDFYFITARSLAIFGLVIAACGGEEDGGGPDRPAAFALSTTQFLPDGEVSLVALVDDPAVPAVLDTGRALEVGGAAALFGLDGSSVFALGGSDAPILTRYQVAEDGSLVAGERLSFADTGIASGFKRTGLVPFLSQEKAYWMDDITQQVLVWNPEAMTLDGDFSLAAAAREDLVFELGERAVVREDGLLFVGVRYRTADDGEAGVAAVLVIDTTMDELVAVLEDDRCGDTVHALEAEDEALYFGTGSVGAVLHALDRPAGYPAPCILRIAPGEMTFDPDYHLVLPDLVGDRSAGRLVAGRDGGAFVLALHEEALAEPLGPETDTFAPYEATAWGWWRIDLAGGTGTALDNDLASAAGGVLHADGRDFVTQVDFEDGSTTLLVPTRSGELAPGLRTPGLPYGLLRVR